MRHRFVWAVAILLLVVASGQAFGSLQGEQWGTAGSVPPDPQALSALKDVPTVSDTWKAVWDPATGKVRVLYNGETAPMPGDLELRAREFLVRHAKLFGLSDGKDLRREEVLDHLLGETVRFQQYYKGIQVYPGDVAVSRNRSGGVFLVASEYRPGLALRTDPSVGAAEASGLAAALSGGGKPETPGLVVWGLTRPFRLAWRVDVKVRIDRLVRVYLDASTGYLITKDNLVSAQAGPLADVYPNNPVSTPDIKTVTLANLDTSGTLSGKYVKVYKFTKYDQQENPLGEFDLKAGPDGFRVAPGDERFNQPSAYYHVNRYHDYFKDTFAYTKRDSPMPVYVSVTRTDGGALNNAYFYPAGDYLVFGKRDNGKDYAIDGDVVGHEYTHSVVETLCKIGDNPIWSEARSMNEALADYFACSVAGDPVEGDYASGSPRDLTNRFRYPDEVPMALQTRDGTNIYTFPEEHDTGRIWGGALWDLRRSLGASVADKVIFASLPLLPAAATFSDGRAALVTADRQLNTGAQATITTVMSNRGIPEQMPYTYADPLAFSDEKSYYVVTGFISPEGGPIETFGVLPVFVSGRKYALIGVVDTGGANVASVMLVFIGADGQVRDKISPKADLASVKVTLRGGQQAPVTRFQFAFAVPEGNEGQYKVGIAVSFDGKEYKLAKTVDGGIVRDAGPAPDPPNEVVSPVPAPPTPTPGPTPPPPAPTPVTPASIQVQPEQAVVPVGAEQRFTAMVTDTAGQTIQNATVQWGIEGGQGVGQITATGIFTGLKAGDATVVAKVGSVSGRARVTVTPAAAPAGVAVWKQIPGSEGAIVLGIAASAAQGLHVLYEAGLDGVRRSVNGQPFEKVAGGVEAGNLPSCVDVNPLEPALVYVGTLNIGLWRSEDGGGSWELWSAELADPFAFFFYGGGHPVITSVVTDAEDSVAIGTLGQGTYVNLAGFGWADISEGMGTAMVNSFAMNREATAMFVGTDNGAYRTREGDTAWRPINNGLKSPRSESEPYAMLPFVNRIAINPLNQKELVAATDADGVFYSPDEGETWIPISNGLPELQVFAVAFDPQVRGRMFCGTAHEGVFVSTDGGKSWQAARGGLTNGTISALLFDPANPNRLYAATLGDGVWYLDLTANIRSEPPRVVATVPANGDVNAPVAAGVSVTFSAAMDPNSLNAATFLVRDAANNAVSGTVTYDAAHFVAKFAPTSPLAGGTTYTAVVTTGAKDAGGTPLQTDYRWSFTTAAAQPPLEVVKGDVTGDGKVNIADATLALRLAVNLQTATPAQLKAADFNSDGKVAVNEVMLILRAAVGLGTL